MPDICTICRNLLRGDVMKLVACKHRFCTRCLTTWTKEANEGRRRQKGYCPVCRSSYNLSNGTTRFKKYINKTPPSNESKRQAHQRMRKQKRNAKRQRRRQAKSEREAQQSAQAGNRENDVRGESAQGLDVIEIEGGSGSSVHTADAADVIVIDE